MNSFATTMLMVLVENDRHMSLECLTWSLMMPMCAVLAVIRIVRTVKLIQWSKEVSHMDHRGGAASSASWPHLDQAVQAEVCLASDHGTHESTSLPRHSCALITR